MAYSALVLGGWNGIASNFDAELAEALTHHFANAYVLNHIHPEHVTAACNNPLISLADDAKALCAKWGDDQRRSAAR
jgi:hypothetical protein